DLAFVACGRFDAYWEHNLSPWDMAAGLLLVREAGGLVSAIDGSPDVFAKRSVFAANAALAEPIRELLAIART
ncbi:MAG: inositol monophosphatase, partial [Methylobacterium sp.]|nr:inositol monophosphatase [Methylobacterium sp.]